jgi:hypothetical protein
MTPKPQAKPHITRRGGKWLCYAPKACGVYDATPCRAYARWCLVMHEVSSDDEASRILLERISQAWNESK